MRARGTAPGSAATRLAVGLLFFLSGAAALVDQVVWNRWLTLAVGSSARATTLVLAAFMAGLGLGSLLAGRLADRRPRRTLAAYAVLEAGIGVWGLLSIPLLGHAVPQISAWMARGLGAGVLPFPLRALLALVVLLPPTLAMGASVPLLARWIADTGRHPARDIALLYAVNTLGGAAGALAAPFYAVERWGLSGSVAAASAVNLGVGAVAWIAFRRRPVAPAHAARDVRGTARTAAAASAGAAFVLAALAFGASGTVGLALEVILHRILALLAGSSVYAFSVVLAGFLTGIAAGSVVAARIAERTPHPGVWLAGVLGALAAGVGIVLRTLDAGGWHRAARWAGGSGFGAEMAAAVIVLLPATLPLGAVAPLVARLAAAAPGRLARRFGAGYALNTAGAVAGALAAGFFLVPGLGTARSGVVLIGLAGLAALAVGTGAQRGRARTAAAALALAGLALGLAAARGTDPVRHALARQFPSGAIRALTEGPVQTIALVEEDNDQQLHFLRLVTNRTSLTGTHLYARRYMRLLGHLPALYASPERSFVISFGTGMTAGALAAHDALRRLDVAEISDAVVDLADAFRDVNGDVLRDPRTRLFVEDGRHVLLAAREPWTLITLEPPPPRDSGVVSLYTVEFYRLAGRRLEPGGVLAQWIPLHSQSETEVRMLVRAFLDGFEHVLGFLPVERDLILLGSDRPLKADLAAWEQTLREESVGASLAEIGFDSAESILACAWADREALERYVAGAPPVTDDRPRVEYFAPYGRRPPLPTLTGLVGSPPPLDRLAVEVSDPGRRERFARARRAWTLALTAAWGFERGARADAERALARALRIRPADRYLQWMGLVSDEHIERARARAEATGSPADWRTLAGKLIQRERYGEAVAAYEQALRRAPNDPGTLLELGDLLLGPGGDTARGRRLLHRFLEIAPGHPAARLVRARLAGRTPRRPGDASSDSR